MSAGEGQSERWPQATARVAGVWQPLPALEHVTKVGCGPRSRLEDVAGRVGGVVVFDDDFVRRRRTLVQDCIERAIELVGAILRTA